MVSNVRKLGVSAVFLGSTFALLGVVVSQVSADTSLASGKMLVWLGACFTFIILGALTLRSRSRTFVLLTTISIVLGLVIDLLLGLSVIKLFVSGVIIWLVVKTGMGALEEVSSSPGGSLERTQTASSGESLVNSSSSIPELDDPPVGDSNCPWCEAKNRSNAEECAACGRPV